MIQPNGPTIGRMDQILSPILGAGVLDPNLVGGPPPAKPKEQVFGPWGIEYPDGTFDRDGIFVPDDPGYHPSIWFEDHDGLKKVSFDEYITHHEGKAPLWHENAQGMIEMDGSFRSDVEPMVAAYGVTRESESAGAERMNLRASADGIGAPRGETDGHRPELVQVADASGSHPGGWSNPAAWAIGQAGKDIADTLEPATDAIEGAASAVGEAVDTIGGTIGNVVDTSFDMRPDAPNAAQYEFKNKGT